MGLRLSENAIAIAVYVFFLLLFTHPVSLLAQNLGACPIRTNQTAKTNQSFRVFGALEQSDNFGKNPWMDTDQILIRDNQMASTTLIPWNRSYQIKFNDFNFNIPESSYIEGIRLKMTGFALGEGKVSDLEIFLLDEFGNPKGINKANKNFTGQRWAHRDSTEKHEWNYGYNADLWDTDWTPAQINNNNFGVSIQVVNLTPDEMELFLDNIMLQVYYSAPVMHCNDACIPYFVAEDPDAIDYIWRLPTGFENHPDVGGLKNIVNMYPATADFGNYELCVSTVYPNATTGPCCLKFEYSNCEKGAIGDFVYEDLNANGVYDSNEPPLKDINLNLHLGDLWKIIELKSNDAGYYSFQSLTRGEYLVSVDLPEGYALSDQASVYNAYLPNASDIIFVDHGAYVQDIDFGIYRYASIAGSVWEDTNGNGERSDDELGLESEVSLYDNDGLLIDQVVTNDLGQYLFDELTPGDYYLEFSNPGDEYIATLQDASDEDKDSDIYDDNGIFKTEIINLISGDELQYIDAGFKFKKGEISGLIWRDSNADYLNNSELGIAGINVQLQDCNANVLQQVSTDIDGNYLFADLDPDLEYNISVEIPAEYASLGIFGENNIDADGLSTCELLKAGDKKIVNGALTPYGTIGDFVWLDQNEDGLQDINEPGVTDVDLGLLDENGSLIGNAKSDVAGQYNFEEVLPGKYFVSVVDLNPIYELTGSGSGINTDADSDFYQGNTTILSSLITMFDGEKIDDIDLGLLSRYGSILGYIWRDGNADYINNTELGIEGINVQLQDCNANVLQQVSTDVDGNYLFADLDPDLDYRISVEIPAQYASLGIFGENNIDADGLSICDLLSAGEVKIVNGALAPYGTIGDFVWLDQNKDGFQDLDEPGVTDVNLGLLDENGNLISNSISDAAGLYNFEEVLPGKYFVSVTDLNPIYELTGSGSGINTDADSDFYQGNTTILSSLITMSDGASIEDIDLGLLTRFGSIFGSIWRDRNGDGNDDANEPGMEGVEVILFDCEDNLLDQTISDQDGNYTFLELQPNLDYYIFFELSDGYAYSFAPGDTDIDHTNGVGSTVCLNLQAGEQRVLNGGFAPYGAIGDYVWLDDNGDGMQDMDESGMEGVEVILRDIFKNHVDSTWTDEQGHYLFEDLYPATYSVIIEELEDYNLAPFNVVSGSPLVSKFTKDAAMYKTSSFPIHNGKIKDNIDAGFVYRDGDINGLIWNDGNGDGTLDASESGLAFIVVFLYNCENEFISETLTDANGNYKFENIAAANEYYIVVSLADGYAYSIGGSDNNLTDNNGVGSTDCIGLTPNGLLELNVGLAPYSTVGDFIWFDANRNGIQDSDESGMGQLTVSLHDEFNLVINTSTTDFQGKYGFEKIYPGQYYLSLALNDNQFLVADFQMGSDNNIDSDFSNNNGIISSQRFDLFNGIGLEDLDCGLIESNIIIGGQVWRDGNGDGDIDSQEPYLQDVEVQLHHCLDGFQEQTTTDVDGLFSFSVDNVNEEYYFQIIFDEELYAVGVNSILTDANGLATTDCKTADLWSIQNDLAALIPFGGIGDFIWNDLNKDGLQDANESGIEGIEVQLYDVNDVLMSSTITDDQGFYNLNKILPGSYYAQINNIGLGFEASPYQQTVSNANDSDFELINGVYQTELFLLLNGNSFDMIDAGFYSTVAGISGQVFEDLKADGKRDNDDLPVSNIEVDLLDEDKQVVSSTITGDDGKYFFTDLLPAKYSIQFNKETSYFFTQADIGDDATDSDVTENILAGTTNLISLQPGQSLLNVDAGIYTFGSVGDFVWNDLNENGLQDNDEVGVEGVTLEVFDSSNNLVSSTQTDGNGLYSFELLPGIYSLFLSAGEGNVLTESAQGLDTNLDSDFNSNNTSFGAVNNMQVLSGGQNNALDAGLILEEVVSMPSSISGIAWEDLNGDGLRENETGVDNIKVVLIDDNGILAATTNTSDNPESGYYEFLDVPAGNYYLEFQFPNNPQSTQFGIGLDENLNSAITNANGSFTTDMINVENDNAYKLNGGYYYFTSIGDYVWNDSNNDGTQNGNELGVNDVLLRLIDQQNNVVSIKSTKFNPTSTLPGYYKFNNIPPGDYHVLISLQAGMFIANAFEGGNDNLDSDIDHANGLNTTRTLSLRSGEEIDDIDIGLVQQPGKIGSRLWLDYNGNGVQDSSEEGLNGVAVKLFTETNVFMESTTTRNDVNSGDGYYIFEDIQPGNYYVQFMLDSDYLSTLSDKGGDDTKDSDITNIIVPGSTNIFNLNPGESNLDADGGIYLPSSVGDYIWLDENRDGIQDDNEIGMENISITIEKIGETFTKNTISDDKGYFRINGLRAGEYFLKYERPAGHSFSTNGQGEDDGKDSDADLNGATANFIIGYNQEIMDMDAGVSSAQIIVGDRVWFDSNANGLQDFDEFGMPGVKVRLLDKNESVIETSTTNQSGEYLFVNPSPGDYYVEFVAPTDHEFTAPKIGFDVYSDSDVNAQGRTDLLFLTDGIYIPTIDAGLKLKGAIQPLDPTGSLSMSVKHNQDFNELNWTDDNASLGYTYELYRSVSAATANMIHMEYVNPEIKTHEMKDREFIRGGVYQYQVFKKDIAGLIVDQATAEVFVPHYRFNVTKLKPNPVSEYFEIVALDETKEIENLDITILSSSGEKLIHSSYTIGQQINVGILVPGIYQVIIDTGKQRDIHQMIKQ